MTGYGVAGFSSDDVEVEINIRTVNGRFLDTRIQLPKEYIPFESEVNKLINKFFRRGSASVYVNRRFNFNSDKVSVISQTQLAKKWAHAYKQICKDLKLPNDLTAKLVVSEAEVIRLQGYNQTSTSEKKAFFKALSAALKN